MIWIARFATLVFALATLATGVLFALQLWDSWEARALWCAVALASALYSAAGLSVISKWPSGHPRRRAAWALLACTVAWDAMTAYGLAHLDSRAQVFAKYSLTTASRILGEDLSKAEVAANEYTGTTDTLLSKALLDGLTRRPVDCTARANRERCAEIERARATLARAEARDRAVAKVHELRAQLAALPAPRTDARQQLLGHDLAALLAAILLQIGAVVGAYVTAPVAPTPKNSIGESHSNEMVSRLPTPLAPTENAQKPPPAQSERASASRSPVILDLATALRNIASTTPPAGLTVDRHGWISGSQRAIAAALGRPNAAALNREMHAAAKLGKIEIRTGATGTSLRAA